MMSLFLSLGSCCSTIELHPPAESRRAIAVRPGAVKSGAMPIGVMFMGRYGEEALLFRLAAQLERVQPWNTRPPIG